MWDTDSKFNHCCSNKSWTLTTPAATHGLLAPNYKTVSFSGILRLSSRSHFLPGYTQRRPMALRNKSNWTAKLEAIFLLSDKWLNMSDSCYCICSSLCCYAIIRSAPRMDNCCWCAGGVGVLLSCRRNKLLGRGGWGMKATWKKNEVFIYILL